MHNKYDTIHRPASLTAEESGACYLEGEGFELEDEDTTNTDFDEHDVQIIDHDIIIEPLDILEPEDDNDSAKFPTTPPIYRLMVNDEEWHNDNVSHSQHIKSPKSPKTPSHKLRQELLRLSKHQCTL